MRHPAKRVKDSLRLSALLNPASPAGFISRFHNHIFEIPRCWLTVKIGVLPAILILLVAVAPMIFSLGSCAGGGGGDDDVAQDQPPGGVGDGADGVKTFWYSYDRNVAVGGGNGVRETGDGGFIVVGTQADTFGSPTDVSLIKTDSLGAVQWKKRYAWPGGAEGYSVSLTGDGGYIIAGRAKTAAGDYDVYLLKTDAEGNPAEGWPKTYGGAANDAGHAVVADSNGFTIAGYRDQLAPDWNISVIRTDTAGNVLWQKSDYSRLSPGCSGQALAASPDGNYVIAGGGNNVSLLKIDERSGLELWHKEYGAAEARAESAYSVAAASDGYILAGSSAAVIGQPRVLGPSDALVIKTDLNGNELWRKTYGGAEADGANSLVVTPDGGYLVAGYTQSFSGTITDRNVIWEWEDLLLIRLDANGGTLWRKVKGNSPPNSDRGMAISGVSDGGFVITGETGANVLLVKTDKNGDTIHLGEKDLTITLPGVTGIIDFGNAVAVASDGVTGFKTPRQVGATVLDLLIATLKSEPVSSFCTGSGSFAFDPVPALPLASVATMLTFTDCVTGPAGDMTSLTGSVLLSVDGVSGDPVTTAYDIQTTLTSITIMAVEFGGTSTTTITGAMLFSRAASGGAFTEVSGSIPFPATTLTISESRGTVSRTRVLGPFTVHDAVDTAGLMSFGTSTTDAVTVDSGLGAMEVIMEQPVQGVSDGADPGSGSFRMTASDNSRLTATITNGTAALAVDTNGDGAVDGTVSVPWIDLD